MSRGKLDRSTLVWIAVLRMMAGYLSAVSFLLFSRTLAGHTGNLTKSMIHLAAGDYEQLVYIMSLTGSYFAGAVVSGWLDLRLTDQQPLQATRVFMSLGIGLGLFMLWPSLEPGLIYYLSFVLGVQTGLKISYHGHSVRISFITGFLTEVGNLLGQRLRGAPLNHFKLCFNLANIFGFLLGALLGAYIYQRPGLDPLLLAALAMIAIGILEAIDQHRYQWFETDLE